MSSSNATSRAEPAKADSPNPALIKRVSRTFFYTLIFAVGLLSFPSVAIWMVAAWLLWHSVSVACGRPGFTMLIACFSILIVRQFAWTPALISLLGMLFIVVLIRLSGAKRNVKQPQFIWTGTACLWLAWGFFAWEWNRVSHGDTPPATWDTNRPVVCLGDSLTSGLIPEPGYPEQLKSMINAPVINLGQSGITTSRGVNRLQRALAHNPQVVIIELGGHDFLRGKSRASTKANLQQLIDGCRKAGAEVVLFEIPRAFIIDPFRGLERELAYENDLELVPDSVIRNLVIWSPATPLGVQWKNSRLSDDGIHTNLQGSQFMAAAVGNSLERLYGRQCRH